MAPIRAKVLNWVDSVGKGVHEFLMCNRWMALMLDNKAEVDSSAVSRKMV